jgi:3',5'-cyclic AMP phosphodiesterase CpdA
MSVLMHISDPHFGTEKPAVVEDLLKLAEAMQPERVLLTGDITQRARRGQFRAARAFCDRLPCPVIAIPGNHDIPLFNLLARCLWPYAGYRQAFGDELEPTWESSNWHVIGVNSTHPGRHKDGELNTQAIDRICQRLSASSGDAMRIVALHHPLHAITEHDEANRARGYFAALHAFAEAGADMVLGGHIHLPYVRPMYPLIDTLSRQIWVVQAGTAVSSRIRNGRPNSVHVIRRLPAVTRGCDVEQWDHSAERGAFIQAKVTHIERPVPESTDGPSR